MTVEQGAESKIEVTPVSIATRLLIFELKNVVAEADVNRRRGGRGDATLNIGGETMKDIIRKGGKPDLGMITDELTRLTSELQI